jgi:hypothetical protein
MTGKAQVPVPTTTRATPHIRLPHFHDAYGAFVCADRTTKAWSRSAFMLADTPLPHGSGANLAVVVYCPRALDESFAFPPYLVGYVRWDARSDRSSLSDNHVQQLQVAL